MNVATLLRKIPSTYTNLQIEASLIKAFLHQKRLSCIALNSVLTEIIIHAVPELCELICSESNGSLTLKQIENVFETLIDDQENRENGTVYTPCYIVDYIIKNTLIGNLDNYSHIIDPACGSGSFLVLAAEQLSVCLNKPIHSVISDNIFGIDIGKDNVRRTKELLTLLALSNGESIDSLHFNQTGVNYLTWISLIT